MDYRYRVVDVFTQTPLEGNPLAVFYDAAGLEAPLMQRIARELNLAETTFVFPPARPSCVANVRIFTPRMEMTFAGHPTIGTAFVLRDEQRIDRHVRAFSFQELVGDVPVRVDEGDDPIIWLQTPPISHGRTFEHSDAAAAAGISPGDLIDGVPVQILSAGNPNVYIAVRDPSVVDRAWVDLAGYRSLLAGEGPTCVFVFAPTQRGAYSRMFAPEHGVVEDPATGSATGPLAAFMMEHGLAPSRDGSRFVSEQGVKMGRRSVLHVAIRGDRGSAGIDVGGHVRAVSRATMSL